ncbi:ABC transporter substrate-binding protein [Ruania alba]|uniref:Putative ABC transport system substrate-binding protein n=1 Tax=Ruania alba TaxID=648782 RepID=A0A1H5KBT8_9MICO|nr:ABC transporter substrate-binding protein [Ruania alba]SEE62276.1 putative ABC transport system substrate-binding protein [Ruania alba]
MTRVATIRTLAVAAGASLALVACSESSDDGSGDSAGGESYSVGITQIVSHPSLDAARDGFKAALADAGLEVTYDEQNAQGDQATATSIATTFASDDLDLILAIATPTAQATAQATTEIPILFTAVTDPVEAGLVDSWESPGSNLTGTSDLNPVEEQLALLEDLAPDAGSLGIVYSSGEVNSQVQVDLATAAAETLGLEVQTATVTNSGEVQQAADSLDVDAYYVPTDNTVVSALESLLQVAESRSVPVIASEGDSVERGAVATYGLDYDLLGRQTGEMAVQVLTEGTAPADIPVETQTELSLIVNPAAAERMGIELSEDLLAEADTVIE